MRVEVVLEAAERITLDGTLRSAPQPAQLVLPPPAALEAEGVAHLLALEASGDLRARHTYLYASAADLTLARRGVVCVSPMS